MFLVQLCATYLFCYKFCTNSIKEIYLNLQEFFPFINEIKATRVFLLLPFNNLVKIFTINSAFGLFYIRRRVGSSGNRRCFAA